MSLMSLMAISTPCINICVIDPLSGLCVGCGRSIEEITRWGEMDETQRLVTMAGLADRMRVARSRGFRGQARRRDR